MTDRVNEILREMARDEAESGSKRFMAWLDGWMETRGGADDVAEVVRLALHYRNADYADALERTTGYITSAFVEYVVENADAADLEAARAQADEEAADARDYADYVRAHAPERPLYA